MNSDIITRAINHQKNELPAITREEFKTLQLVRGSHIGDIMDERDPLKLMGKRSLLHRLRLKFKK